MIPVFDELKILEISMLNAIQQRPYRRRLRKNRPESAYVNTGRPTINVQRPDRTR
jgi:hypothetical protein